MVWIKVDLKKTHRLIHLILIEHLLCSNYYAGLWGSNGEQNRDLSFYHRTHSLVKRIITKQKVIQIKNNSIIILRSILKENCNVLGALITDTIFKTVVPKASLRILHTKWELKSKYSKEEERWMMGDGILGQQTHPLFTLVTFYQHLRYIHRMKSSH